MKLVHEKNVNLLLRTLPVAGNNMPLLPGDLVHHIQDRNSSGMVIAVSHDAREAPDLEALVLWSKLPFNGNYPPLPSNPPSNTNPCGEISLMADLASNGLISRKTLMEKLGLDPDETPTESV